MVHCVSRRLVLWAGLACLMVTIPGYRAAAQAGVRFAFGIVSAEYRDLDGDHDPFPDTGETGRVVFMIQNGRQELTGVTFVLASADPDVACITEWRAGAGSLAPGQTVTVGSLDPTLPGFTFRAADTLDSSSGADPARIELCLRVEAVELGELSEPVCSSLAADVDLPSGAAQTFVPGPDGIPSTGDDGTVLESFDADRDGDALFTVNDTFRMTDAGTGRTEHGFYLRGSYSPGVTGTVAAVACGGFATPAEGNPACVLDPDFPMDWHFHCPPDATGCPNAETGACVGGCSFATPRDGQKALSPPNSLHMGAHFDLQNSLADTTHLRTLQAFVSGPLDLALFPRPGDLELSMFHIADLMDNTFVSAQKFQCLDCGDVQAQMDRDPDPAMDDWGAWDKLAPFQNVYEHVTIDALTFGSYYCHFTPADTGAAPPAPRGAHETMCFPQGAWSRCGSVRGTIPQSVGACIGPGVVDPSGKGVWVETRFDLSPYLGQRVRIRWIGSTWMADSSLGTYLDQICDPLSCETWASEDGWWLDDIRISGVLASQVSPIPDPRPAPGTLCPALCADLDGDGYGAPGSALCPAGAAFDCNDLDPRMHPYALELCNGLDDDCNGVVPAVEADADNDGWRGCAGDCNDADRDTYPDAPEVNDGRDNQCLGSFGFGVIDEISGRAGFSDATRPDRFCWPHQLGATSYLVARSSAATFSASCATFALPGFCISDPAVPAPGEAYFYLVRAQQPHLGSWGQDSSGRERTGICGL